MDTTRISRFWSGIFFIACMGSAHAQTFPAQSLRLVVPWAPGGATDVIARLIAQPLWQQLGQPVVVENKPGAAGNIGTAQFVRSKPDGYSLIMATSTTNAVNSHLYTQPGFDPVKDFAPIVLAASIPNILVVPAASSARSARDLIEQARANPGKLTYGSGGIGASQHLAGALFANFAKLNIIHVPYKGGGPAAADLIAGHLSFMLDTVVQNIVSGQLRALAVASKSRIPALPDVPTFDELGIQGIYASAWYGIMAPAGTPKAVVDRLNFEINKILKSAEMRKRLIDLGAEVGGGTPEDFAKFAIAEITRYAEIVRISGAKLE